MTERPSNIICFAKIIKLFSQTLDGNLSKAEFENLLEREIKLKIFQARDGEADNTALASAFLAPMGVKSVKEWLDYQNASNPLNIQMMVELWKGTGNDDGSFYNCTKCPFSNWSGYSPCIDMNKVVLASMNMLHAFVTAYSEGGEVEKGDE